LNPHQPCNNTSPSPAPAAGAATVEAAAAAAAAVEPAPQVHVNPDAAEVVPAPQRTILPAGLPRAAHHYSSVLGGGEVEPVVEGPKQLDVVYRLRTLAKEEATLGEEVPEGTLPWQAQGGRPAPAWLASLDRATRDLMAALHEAQPWANGLQPVRRRRTAVPGSGGSGSG
ncbi:hypothetical protein Agub_g12680, partial [Astrephomene gubernaculifera]